VILNYLPLRFDADVFNGSFLEFDVSESDFESDDDRISLKLRELRKNHHESHFFYRSGRFIYCAPLSAAAPIIGNPREFNVFEDFQFANSLARQALLQFFKDANNTITDLRPLSFVLLKHNLTTHRQDVFGIYPEYSFEVRPLAPHEGRITSGLLVEFAIRYQFLKTLRELISEGVRTEGLYVVAARQEEPDSLISPEFARRYLGQILSTNGNTAVLADSDVEEVDTGSCFLEGSRLNVEIVGRTLLGKDYDLFASSLLKVTYQVMGAEHQVQRLNQLGSWLEERSPLTCCVGLGVRVHRTPHECARGLDAGYSQQLRTPECVLRPGGSITVPWPVDKQIDVHGPYDAESFPEKRVRIAVISPEEFVGEVGQFLRQMKEGVPSSKTDSPFRQGFIRKYHLNSCDFTFHEVKRSLSLEEGYKAASLEAVADNPHLALVVIREQCRDLPDSVNPYYTTKARMMSQGVPVQVLKIETLRLRSLPYVLNNLSLACYAKLGGIPWTIVPNQDIVHEIVVGIGSARLTKSRRGAGERVIGITTVFSGDGQYLLSNSTKEVNSDEYLSALVSSLNETVAELRSRFNWHPKDRVRFIFHQSFKKYKDVEAAAVKRFAQSLSDFDVKYAFVHVSMNHNWMLFDPSSPGVQVGRGMKGKMVPNRGLCVPLGPNTALLTLTGPWQVKTALQGCPHPVLVNLHQDSTFTSLEYVARQIFNLSFMSWRGFNPSTLPVSIAYSEMIVDLLGHLKYVKNWNPETLATRLKERRWFL